MINELRTCGHCARTITGATLILFLHTFAACGEVKDQAAIEKSIQALVDLKDGDENGFDAQADILIKAGADALPLLEAKQKALAGKQAFRLQRVRDMIVWPIDIRGVMTTRIANARLAEACGITPFTIITSFNGTPVSDVATYDVVKAKAQKDDITTATLDALFDGRKRSVKVPGMIMGLVINNYPGDLTQYIHLGRRSEAWDQDAQEGLKMRMQSGRASAAEHLARALEKGANDPLLLVCAMQAYLDADDPEHVLGLWKANSGKVDLKLYGGKFTNNLQVEAAQALLETGDSAGATKLLDPVVKSAVNFGVRTTSAKGLLAVAIEDSDPKRAEALYKEAAADQKGSYPYWNERLVHLLKQQKRWDEVAALAGMYEFASGKAALEAMGELKSAADAKPIEHWALVYRQNFDVDKAAGYLSHYHPDVFPQIGMTAANGRLRFDNPTGTGIVTWGYYMDCRVEVDAKIERAPDRPNFSPPAVSVNALFAHRLHPNPWSAVPGLNYRFEFSVEVQPRRYAQFFFNDHKGFSYYDPLLDYRKEHHLALECNNGKVTSFIDGKDVDVTFVPAQFSGHVGLGMRESLSTFDNFEIYTPTDREVDNKKIRGFYDLASAAFNKGDLKGALGFLEQAAVAPNIDLGRLYAAYIKASGLSRQDASKLVHERMGLVATAPAFFLLLAAETQAELIYLDQPEYNAVEDLWISGMEFSDVGDQKYLQQAKAAHDCGRLEPYTRFVQSQYRLKRNAFADVEAAYRLAMAQDPSSVCYLFELAQFYVSENKPELAEPLIHQIMEKAPNAKFLESDLKPFKNDGKAVKPPAPPADF